MQLGDPARSAIGATRTGTQRTRRRSPRIRLTANGVAIASPPAVRIVADQSTMSAASGIATVPSPARRLFAAALKESTRAAERAIQPPEKLAHEISGLHERGIKHDAEIGGTVRVAHPPDSKQRSD
jgi:hypothetical protein